MTQQKTTKLKLKDLQLDSISYIEEIQDAEAAKINGGNSAIAAFNSAFDAAQALNIEMMMSTVRAQAEPKSAKPRPNF